MMNRSMKGNNKYSFERDDDYGILKKALDVELPEDFDPTKPPETGEEYIQHVMYEAKQCKEWVTADIDTSKFNKNQTFKVECDNMPQAPKHLLPNKDWQKEKTDDFRNFRCFIEKKLIEDPSTVVIHDSHWKDKVKTEIPTLSQILDIGQESKLKIFEIILENLNELEDGQSFTRATGIWLYSILSTIEIPLSPHMCYCLRDLARKCATIRSKLNESTARGLYIPLNLFICLIANYFRQKDLSD